jgi:hypothetical protein
MSRRKQQRWQGTQLEDTTVGQKADQRFNGRRQRQNQAGEVKGVKRRRRTCGEECRNFVSGYLRHLICSRTLKYPNISIIFRDLDIRERSGSRASWSMGVVALEHGSQTVPLHARAGRSCVRFQEAPSAITAFVVSSGGSVNQRRGCMWTFYAFGSFTKEPEAYFSSLHDG